MNEPHDKVEGLTERINRFETTVTFAIKEMNTNTAAIHEAVTKIGQAAQVMSAHAPTKKEMFEVMTAAENANKGVTNAAVHLEKEIRKARKANMTKLVIFVAISTVVSGFWGALLVKLLGV